MSFSKNETSPTLVLTVDVKRGNLRKNNHIDEVYSIDTKMNVISDIHTWMSAFDNNKNTGNKYEIVAGNEILRLSGLDGITRVQFNNELFKGVAGIVSHTQNDSNGTGDIEIVYIDKPSMLFSVTQYKKKISKCIINPSGKYYGIYKTHYRSLLTKTYDACVNYKREKYGDKPIVKKNWRNREKMPQVKTLHETIARHAAKNWNSFDEKHRIDMLKKFLDLDAYLNTRSDGIIFCSDKKICKAYRWKLKTGIELVDCLSASSDGVYIYHYAKGKCKDEWFLKVQVKFNNGVIEFKKNVKPLEPKCGSTFTSWNCVARLEKIFDMEELY